MEGTAENMKEKSSSLPKKRMQRTRSFTDAIRDKYCTQENDVWSHFIIDLTIRGKPKNNGNNSAELGHLRNVVLNNQRVSTGGIPQQGLMSLCPNLTDLDLSSNLLQSWAEVLPILSHLPSLTFLNLSRNYITQHKEVLSRWSTPLPRLENVVLNSTGVPIREVLALASLMPALKELHICCNCYKDLGNIEAAINGGALPRLECLRLNENNITSWAEVWKLRRLPSLRQLILSENPLCDVFYTSESQQDLTMIDGVNCDITCCNDGGDCGWGSSHVKCITTKVVPNNPTCSRALFSEASESVSTLATSAEKDVCTRDALLKERVLPSENKKYCASITDEKNETVQDLSKMHEVLDKVDNAVCRKESGKLWLPSSTLEWHSSLVCELVDKLVFSAWQHVTGKSCADIGRVQHISCCETSEPQKNRKRLQGSGDVAHCPKNSIATETDYEKYSIDMDFDKGTSRAKAKLSPFEKLDTLCLSRTSICEIEHLQALNQFPQLKSLKIMDITLFSDVQQEDRRKLYIASLPGIKVLNSSEITPTEREKAERHYLRHFLNMQEKAPRYKELEAKHGQIQPVFDIDLGARFQKDATLTFFLSGEKKFQETLSLLQPVGKLRSKIAERLAIPRKSFRMFHFACGPRQQEQVFDELCLDSLPLSRFDFMDGDEIHVEFIDDVGVNPVVSFSKKAIC